MMKRLVIFIGLILLLAACNSQTNTENEPNEVEPDEEVVEEETDEETTEDGEAEPKTEETDANEDENNTNEQPEQTNDSEQANQQTNRQLNNDDNENVVDDGHEKLVNLAYQIFDAQTEKNYEFLESIISKGTKIDKDNDTFYFENVTYPHEQPFLTEEDLGDIELRYTHENNKNSVIVGFGIINYETEYSYVVDFEFVNENGNWKMNDMELNK